MPKFLVKNNFQKRADIKFEDILTPSILEEICRTITGKTDYEVEFDEHSYNIGRLAKLYYEDSVAYISISAPEGQGRNSSFQSFSSALIRFLEEDNTNKSFYFYFLPPEGNVETDYFIFMYRLMVTAGTELIGANRYLSREIIPFNSVEDIVNNRNSNRLRNRSNYSTYMTVGDDGVLELYGKTYGASKYETSLLCLAINKIANTKVRLYQIPEGDLKVLPERALGVLQSLNNLEILRSDISFEKRQFYLNDSLRSPQYNLNLLIKLGEKSCVLCDCLVPEVIQGAHIWPVARIKNQVAMSFQQKLDYAIDGENGIWLCQNHHKLFDTHYILLDEEGYVNVASNVRKEYNSFIRKSIKNAYLGEDLLTESFITYLNRRNVDLDRKQFERVEL